MPTKTPILETRDLGRRAVGGAWMLRHVSLRLDGGDRLGIAGAAGAGKTVLLRTLALLDPLDAGQLHWRGRQVSGRDTPRYRAAVAYLRQRPATSEGTVEDTLRQPFSLVVHRDKAYDRRNVARWLSLAGRDEAFLQKRCSELSGGEAQIVALVQWLQIDPQVLLLDEPTASLDAAATTAVEQLVSDWIDAAPRQRAYVWVTHDTQQAHRMCRRKVCIEEGTIVEET